MIVDIHTHIFPPEIAEKALRKLSRVSGCSPFNDGTLAHLTASMQEAGVDLSVIMPVATAPRQVESVNDYAAKLNEKYDGKQIISFGAIHPDYANYKKELARLRSLGFRGIKLHPVYQDVNIDDIRFLRILECAAENNLVTLTHAGFDISFPGVDRCGPQMIRRVVDQVGNFPFILAHMGGWEVWEDAVTYLKDTGVFFDTSFSIGSKAPLTNPTERIPLMQENLLRKMLKNFSSNRILFGSDNPWTSQKESVEAVRNLPLSAEDKQKILGENAMRLLKIF